MWGTQRACLGFLLCLLSPSAMLLKTFEASLLLIAAFDYSMPLLSQPSLDCGQGTPYPKG